MPARILVATVAVAGLLAACGGSPPETPSAPVVPDATTPAPPPAARASDDAPVRTRSGKVLASRDPERPPALGPTPAKVVVVVYSDFQCPVCRRITDATYQITEEWPGEVRVEFRQLALAMHGNALNAAVASLAAHRQGKFWPMHDQIYAGQDTWNTQATDNPKPFFMKYASAVGLDMAQFESCYDARKHQKRIEANFAEGVRRQVNSTPTFIVDNRKHVSAMSYDELKAIVDSAAKK